MATIGSFNPNLTFPHNNRAVGHSPQSNGGNTNNVSGIGNTVTNNQTNNIDQSRSVANNGTTNVYNITINEGDTVNHNHAAGKAEKGKCKGKGKGKGKGKAKKKGAAKRGQVGSPQQQQAGAAGQAGQTQMLMKMMGMMMNLMQQMQGGMGGMGGGLAGGGLPSININRGMGGFRHPGFMM